MSSLERCVLHFVADSMAFLNILWYSSSSRVVLPVMKSETFFDLGRWQWETWLSAVVLGPGDPARDAMVARAQGHFLEVLRALALTEAWPEGYLY